MARYHLYQMTKTIINAFQFLAIVIALSLSVAVVKANGPADSRLTYDLVICLLSFPLLAYQTLTPCWRFTRRLTNPYVFAAIDAILSILWLAAFLGELVWVQQGSHAAKQWKDGDGLCQVFAWGSTRRCQLGRGSEILGIMIL